MNSDGQGCIGTIGTLEPGQSGYTVPWAFCPEYAVYAFGGGTLTVEVGRNVDGEYWSSIDDLASVIRTLNKEAP